MDGFEGLARGVQRFTLDALGSSQEAVITGLDGGRGFISRLAALGFVPGARIGMVQNYGAGPLIVQVHRARVALGRAEAHHVVVQREAQS